MYVIVTQVLLLTLGYHAEYGLALKNANIASLIEGDRGRATGREMKMQTISVDSLRYQASNRIGPHSALSVCGS